MRRREAIRSLLTIPAIAAAPICVSAHAVPAAEAPAASTGPPDLKTVGADACATTVVQTFNSDQFAALSNLSTILVPSLPDTPGAREAGVASFLDFLIGQSPADRVKLYKDGLDRLNEKARVRIGKPFGKLLPEQAAPILAPLRRPWTYEPLTDPFARFLLAVKQDALKATRNSREYISVVSRRHRRAGGIGIYWYSISD